MRFVVFNSSGMPTRAGSCPENALNAQALYGETVIEWDDENDGDPAMWRFENGELVFVGASDFPNDDV